MNLLNILNSVKPLCKIDIDEVDFDTLLKQFINDTVKDIFQDIKTPSREFYPIINGEVEIDTGVYVVKVVPPLEVGDQIIGNKIFTKHTGALEIYTVEEAPELINDTDTVDLPNNILSIIKYNVASLWYGFKKKGDLSTFWKQYYDTEKMKKISNLDIEETYSIQLPFADFFN